MCHTVDGLEIYNINDIVMSKLLLYFFHGFTLPMLYVYYALTQFPPTTCQNFYPSNFH